MPGHQVIVPNLALEWKKQDICNTEIAKRFGVSPSAVTKFFKRRDSDQVAAPMGPTSHLTFGVEQFIRDLLAQNPFLLPKEIRNLLHLTVSERTVQRWLHAMDFHRVRAKKRPLLTYRHQMDRLAWAEAYERHNHQAWIFADESQFDTSGHSLYCWIQRGTSHPVQVERNSPIRIQIWAAISWWGKSKLVFFPQGQRNTGDTYSRLIDHVFYTDPFFEPRRNMAFYHDNSPVHSGKLVTNMLDLWGMPHPRAPAVSPELNPIEKIWHMMKERMPYPRPTTLEGLKRDIETAYQSITLREIRAQTNHLTTVKAKLREARGGYLPEE